MAVAAAAPSVPVADAVLALTVHHANDGPALPCPYSGARAPSAAPTGCPIHHHQSHRATRRYWCPRESQNHHPKAHTDREARVAAGHRAKACWAKIPLAVAASQEQLRARPARATAPARARERSLAEPEAARPLREARRQGAQRQPACRARRSRPKSTS